MHLSPVLLLILHPTKRIGLSRPKRRLQAVCVSRGKINRKASVVVDRRTHSPVEKFFCESLHYSSTPISQSQQKRRSVAHRCAQRPRPSKTVDPIISNMVKANLRINMANWMAQCWISGRYLITALLRGNRSKHSWNTSLITRTILDDINDIW